MLAAARHMVGHAERQQDIYAVYAQAARVFQLSDRFGKRAAREQRAPQVSMRLCICGVGGDSLAQQDERFFCLATLVGETAQRGENAR